MQPPGPSLDAQIVDRTLPCPWIRHSPHQTALFGGFRFAWKGVIRLAAPVWLCRKVRTSGVRTSQSVISTSVLCAVGLAG